MTMEKGITELDGRSICIDGDIGEVLAQMTARGVFEKARPDSSASTRKRAAPPKVRYKSFSGTQFP